MLKSPNRVPRPILSPKTIVSLQQRKQHPTTQEEYQIAYHKTASKKESSAKNSYVDETNSEKKPFIRRKLSFKKVQTESKPALLLDKSSEKTPVLLSVKSSEQLALEIEYNQFKTTKARLPETQKLELVHQSPQRRIRRIRSSSYLSRDHSIQGNKASSNRLKQVQEENKRLKEEKKNAFEKIEILQSQFEQQKDKFEEQTVAFQRQIEAIRRQIEQNKVGIGHLFSYQNFDPLKMLVKPIVELQIQNSHFQSYLNKSQTMLLSFEELPQFQMINNRHEKLTNTTGSREDNCEMDNF